MEPPELIDLPEPLRAFLERAGYHVRAAVVGRVDGRPLVDLDRKRLPAILRAALDTSTEGGPARDALVHTDDGRVAWSPEAAPVVAKVAAARKKVVKKAAKR